MDKKIGTLVLLMTGTLCIAFIFLGTTAKAQNDGLPEYQTDFESSSAESSSSSSASSQTSITVNCIGNSCITIYEPPGCCVQDALPPYQSHIDPSLGPRECNELTNQEQVLKYRILRTNSQPMTYRHARWLTGEQIKAGLCSLNLPVEWTTNINFCGDGKPDEANKECDDGDMPGGNSNAPDAHCRPDCTLARCGDGIVDPQHGETCDQGPLNGKPGVACLASCNIAVLQQLINDVIPETQIYLMSDYKSAAPEEKPIFIMRENYNWNSFFFPLSPLLFW